MVNWFSLFRADLLQQFFSCLRDIRNSGIERGLIGF